MAKRKSELFTEAEKEQIRQAVAQAESRSSGEIVTMVVPASERYLEAERLGAVLLAGLFAVVVAVALRHVTIWTYIPLVCLLFFPSLFLLRLFPRLKLSLVGRRRLSEAVRERAMQAFYQKELHRTLDQTGILIFISLLERKVWILGDRGINDKIPPGSWQGLATKLASGIREGKAAPTLCRIVGQCGDILAQHFPRRESDLNELPDDLLTS